MGPAVPAGPAVLCCGARTRPAEVRPAVEGWPADGERHRAGERMHGQQGCQGCNHPHACPQVPLTAMSRPQCPRTCPPSTVLRRCRRCCLCPDLQILSSIPWIVPLALLSAPLLLSSPLLLLTLVVLVVYVPRLREVLMPALQGLWEALQTLAHTPLAEHEHTRGPVPREPRAPGARGSEQSPHWLLPHDRDSYR